MTSLKLICAATASLALCAGVASAQMSSGSMSSSHMSNGMKMSKRDMKTMSSCQAMSHDAMMAASKCKHLMAKHPDMFNADGTMKSAPQ